MPKGIDKVELDYEQKTVIATRLSEHVWGFSLRDCDEPLGTCTFDFELLNDDVSDLSAKICANWIFGVLIGIRPGDASILDDDGCAHPRSVLSALDLLEWAKFIDAIVRN